MTDATKKQCALCDEPARVGVVCDACHDSMGTRTTLQPKEPPITTAPVGCLDGEQAIRDALAAIPAEALKPWRQLDRMPYLHATDDPNASPWGTPVIGRFDYMETMHYIAACHPETMRALLAELDRLRSASRQEGWQLVPVEPTDAMTWAGQQARYPATNSITVIYRAMLAAAPHQAQEAQGDRHGE
jgi:hypothetical protein